jgi:hypothetical protein
MHHSYFMKRFSFLLFLLLGFTNLHAEIGVEYFQKHTNDMDARVTYPVKDPDGEPCALIKVVTTQTGFTFDCGLIGIMKTEQHPSEIWVYVPFGVKRITINHQQFGVLRDYFFPEPIEKASVYILKLVTGRVIINVEEQNNDQYVVITPTPPEAMIYINETFVQTGTYTARLKPGNYNYRVESPLYHAEAGVFKVEDKKIDLPIALNPAFGSLSISSSPEEGAKIFIDRKLQSTVTPATLGQLESKEYTVQVIKEMYNPSELKKVVIRDGETTPLNVTLTPNFARLHVDLPSDASLLINTESKGKGNWEGRLSPGTYTLEARQDKHYPDRKNVELIAGEDRRIELKPEIMYGTLDVSSEPIGAIIRIDGKEYGTTPNIIGKIPVGDHELVLEKSGYGISKQTVSINEKNETILKLTLSNTHNILFTSSPDKANIFVDNRPIGLTPCSMELNYGKHSVRLERANYENLIQDIVVDNSTKNYSFTLLELGKSFSFNTIPSYTLVSVDNKESFSTPATKYLTYGAHHIQIQAYGYRTVDKNIQLDRTSSVNQTFVLHEKVMQSFGDKIGDGLEGFGEWIGDGFDNWKDYREEAKTDPGLYVGVSGWVLDGSGYGYSYFTDYCFFPFKADLNLFTNSDFTDVGVEAALYFDVLNIGKNILLYGGLGYGYEAYDYEDDYGNSYSGESTYPFVKGGLQWNISDGLCYFTLEYQRTLTNYPVNIFSLGFGMNYSRIMSGNW